VAFLVVSTDHRCNYKHGGYVLGLNSYLTGYGCLFKSLLQAFPE